LGTVRMLSLAMFRKIADLASLVRLTAFEINGENGRAKERHRRVLITAAASAVAKVISVVSGLVTVPLTLDYLGPERYGLWMTILSTMAMLSFADLGVGNGLLSAVAEAHGRDDTVTIRRLVSDAYSVLGVVALLLFTVFGAMYPLVNWALVFNVDGQAAKQEVGPAVAVLVTCFALAIPGAIVHRTQMGLQRGSLAGIWQCVGSLLGVVGVVVAVNAKAGLPWLILSLSGPPLLASAVNAVIFFKQIEPEISPSLRLVSNEGTRSLLGSGAFFLLLQLVAAITYMSDGLIIAKVLGAAKVSEYSIPERLFSLISVLLAMFVSPLWPAYGEAMARQEYAWVRRTLFRSIFGAFFFSSISGALLILAAPWLLKMWVGNSIRVPFMLLVGLAVWKIIEATASAAGAYLNGLKFIRLQVCVGVITAGASVALKLILVAKFGVSGSVWATVVCYSAFAVLPFSYVIWQSLKQTENLPFDVSL
jgi:O-antigen/teichoic acid export membrane protein